VACGGLGAAPHDDAGVKMCVVLVVSTTTIPLTHTHTHTFTTTQPLRLEIKKKLTARSDRIKSVDLHPTEVRPEGGRKGGRGGPLLLVRLADSNVNHRSAHLLTRTSI